MKKPLAPVTQDQIRRAARMIGVGLDHEAITQWLATHSADKAEIERLRQSLSSQTHQTQITAQQKHDAVLEQINRHGGLPEAIGEPQGHPIEQIVGTVLACRDAENERLEDENERLRLEIQHLRMDLFKAEKENS